MTLAEILCQGENYLKSKGIAEAKLNAWYLFAYCFSMERSYFFLHSEEDADVKKKRKYEEYMKKRARHIPLEYITNETEFMGLPFYVDERVLIPRQDTECLVEEVLKVSRGKKVLDLCTGSGCIGISLAALGQCESVTLADISPEVLCVARENAKKNGVEVTIVQSDLFENIHEMYDIIVSNPPYIRSGDIEELMPEVRDYEPRLALDGTEDGLLFYRSIIRESRNFLNPSGDLFLEIGCDQGKDVEQLMLAQNFSRVEIKKDLAGLHRIVQGQKQ